MRLTGLILGILAISFLNSFSQIPNYVELRQKRNTNGDIDFSKIDFLKEELSKADIILLGEPSHTPQYYDIKIQLIKYLHKELGFDVLAFESGLYQMEMVNADIKKGKDIAASFEDGLFPIWTSSDDFQKLYGYLDSLRVRNDGFDISGFDCQVSANNASKRFVHDLETELQIRKIIVEKRSFQILQAQFENLETGRRGLTDDFNEESLDEIRKLLSITAKLPDLRLYSQSLRGWLGHFSDLYYNKIFEKLKMRTFGGKDSNTRDSLMAMQMLFLYRELYPGRKIIGWGANLHFANKTQDLNTVYARSSEFVSMGSHLKKALGEKVFFLGVTTDNNYPKVIEKYLADKKTDMAWISGANLKKNFSSGLFEEPATGDWSQVVDGILYFDSAEPGVGLAGKYFLEGKIISSKDKQAVSFASLSVEGATTGTASGIDGSYFLKIDSSKIKGSIKISCIGYKTKIVSIRGISKSGTIYLTPEIRLLNDVIVKGKAPTATEILQQAIDNIPRNYLQIPFNMEFYSKFTAKDTITKKAFELESVFSTYYEGYFKTAKKNYRLNQKRERDKYFMKEKTHGVSMWPIWEVAFNDIFSNQAPYQIATLESLEKIEPTLAGFELYDGDTVFVIKYNYSWAGTIYISSKDYAILKHVTTASGKGYQNRMEIIYKKQDGKYFPYAANGDYVHQLKVDGTKKSIKITNRSTLNKIETGNVEIFEYSQEAWHPKNISYSKEWWDKNYPIKD